MNIIKPPENIENEEIVVKKKECRYCLSDDKLEKLIDPCNCEGTMKYVHQECLENWINNGHRHLPGNERYLHDSNGEVFLTICEICKYKMKYTKNYKNSLMKSILKLAKSIFGNVKNCFLLALHSVIIYFLFKRLSTFYREITEIFRKKFSLMDPTYIMNLIHNITVVTSILVGMNDIYMFYNKMLVNKRKCSLQFLSKANNDEKLK